MLDLSDAGNYRNCYVAEKSIVSKLSKMSIPNIDSAILRLESSKFQIPSTFNTSHEISCQIASWLDREIDSGHKNYVFLESLIYLLTEQKLN